MCNSRSVMVRGLGLGLGLELELGLRLLLRLGFRAIIRVMVRRYLL